MKQHHIMTNNNDTSTSSTMKAAIATGFGEIDENIYLRDDWPRPTLPNKKSKKKERFMAGHSRLGLCVGSRRRSIVVGEDRLRSASRQWTSLHYWK
jgi:hypothetical protein